MTERIGAVPVTWTVAGGKGGSGKSFLTVLLGMFLANEGRDVVLVDADFEGANLHSFLGIKNPGCSLTDFFEGHLDLREAVCDTHIPNLRLIPGDIHSIDPHSLNHFRKQKLYRHLRTLQAHLVLIDLGAGSNLNIVDTFLQADRMVAVTTPQTISLENFYHFMNKSLFRKLNTVLEHHGLKPVVDEAWRNRGYTRIRTIQEFIAYIERFSPEINRVLEKELAGFGVHIVLNQVRNAQQVKSSGKIEVDLNRYYGIRAELAGTIGYHEDLWEYNNQFDSLFDRKKRPPLLDEIETIARTIEGSLDLDKLVKDDRVPVRLVADTANAVRALQGKKIVDIVQFPFAVGRLSKRSMDKLLSRNDLYLRDERPYSISRSHFSIVKEDGKYYFRDRESRLGAQVNEHWVGGREENKRAVQLKPGKNILRFGRSARELSFTILVSE